MASSGLLGRSNIVWHCTTAGASPSRSAPIQLPLGVGVGGCGWWGIKAASPPGLGSRRLCLSLESAFSRAPHHALHQLSPLSKQRGDKRQCVRFIPPPGKAQISLLSAEDKRHHFRKGCCCASSPGRFRAASSPVCAVVSLAPMLSPRGLMHTFLLGYPHPAPTGVASSWLAGDLWEGRDLHRTKFCLNCAVQILQEPELFA